MQLADRRLYGTRYKWLDGDCNVIVTSRRSVTVATKWLKTSGLRPHERRVEPTRSVINDLLRCH